VDPLSQARDGLRRSSVAAAVVVSLVAVACTASRNAGGGAGPPVGPPADAGPIPHVRPGGAPTLRAAISRLCVTPSVPGGTPASGSLPPDLDAIAHDVEIARGHSYVRQPRADAITDQEMDRRLAESFAAYYPKRQYERRTVAWRTIGVIGGSDDLYRAYRAFFEGQVVGFYDPETGELVYLGSGDLGFAERFTLAHELTHALDDQIFDLKRLDVLTARCQDERAEAALGLVEGSAQYFAAVTVAQDPQVDLGDLLATIGDSMRSQQPPAGVPPFLNELELWPYVSGEAFVASLVSAGGTDAVDAAFRRFPTSTEQLIHPELFPSDRSRPVSIPDITSRLGPRWGDLDAMTIGEEWVLAMLGLRLDRSTAEDAAAGWSGGGYRAFTDGNDVVVVMTTAWDTVTDADAFAGALRRWSGGSTVPDISITRSTVTAVFATAPATLAAAMSALG
jgi:hypothetical protein